MPKVNLTDEISKWRSIGEALSDGDIILSPFELPVEEERRGDPDQSDDNSNFMGQDNLCVSVEPSLAHGKKDVSGIVIDRDSFKFFLDGSIRTKYVGEYVEGALSFPIIVSEVAVGVVERIQNRLHPFKIEKRLFFVFPHKDSGVISDSTYCRLEQMQQRLSTNNSFSRIEFLKKSDITGDVKNSLLGKVRNIMHNMEHEVARSLNRPVDDWLIMDGAIRKQEFLGLPKTVGVAKSFSRKPVFSINNGPILTLSAYMRNLRDGERSCVFVKSSTNDTVLKRVMFWYLRIRTFPPMEPLGGIVKIDMALPEKGELKSQDIALIDQLSAEIYRMRAPTVYPWPRWPNYIYPVRIAEMYMASTFLSPFSLSQVGQEMKSMIERRVVVTK